MPIIVTCPTCSRKLRVPEDLLGKLVKCPECQEPFRAETEPDDEPETAPEDKPSSKAREQRVSTGRRSSGAVSERGPARREEREEDEDHPRRPVDDFDDEQEDRPRERSGGSVRLGWKRVRLGLHLFIVGIYIMIAGFVLALLCVGLAALVALIGGTSIVAALTSSKPNTGAAGAGGAALIAAVVLAVVGYGSLILGSLVNWVLQMIGQVFFLWIPDKPGTGRRPLAIATLSLSGAQWLLLLSGYGILCMGGFLRSSGGSEAMGLGGNCANFLSSLCGIAWFFVFMFLLRAIARGTGNEQLGSTCIMYMIIVPVFGILAFLTFIGAACIGGMATVGLASKSSSAGGAATAGMGFIILLVVVYGLILLISLGLWIWYVVILHQARSSVDARLRR